MNHGSFAAAFADADETIVPDIYFVRDSEAEKQRVSAADLALAAGRDRTIKLVVTAFKTASSGKERTWQVIGRSLNNPLKRDVVKFTTTIR